MFLLMSRLLNNGLIYWTYIYLFVLFPIMVPRVWGSIMVEVVLLPQILALMCPQLSYRTFLFSIVDGFSGL